MAGGFNNNGQIERIPGVYGNVDATQVQENQTSVGNLGIIGAFPGLQKNVPQTFFNIGDISKLDLNDTNFQRIAAICNNPANDAAIGSPGSVTLINVQTTTQAALTVQDADGNDSLVIKSKLWGPKGNAVVFYAIGSVADNKLLDILIYGGGQTESYSSVGQGDTVKFICDPTVCTAIVPGSGDTTLIDIDNTTLTWHFLKALQVLLPNGGTYTFTGNKLPISGKLIAKATTITGADVLNSLTAVAHGLDAAGAPLVTDTLAFPANTVIGDEKTFKVANVDAVFSRIDSITWTALGTYIADGGHAPSIKGNAFVVTLTEGAGFPYISQVMTFINGSNSKGWAAVAMQPQVSVIPSSAMDKQTGITTIGTISDSTGGAVFRADIWALLIALGSSQIVSVARATGGNSGEKMPAPWGTGNPAVIANLLGGTTSGVSIAADYTAGLAVLETQDLQVIACMESDKLVIAPLKLHLTNAALAGSERDIYYGAPTGLTLAVLYSTYTTAANSRGIQVAGQDIKLPNPITGQTEQLPPIWCALMFAAMQCGRDIGIPLTNKYLSILGTVQEATWVPGTHGSDNLAIKNGIMAITVNAQGYRVLRSNTSYITDTTVALCEMSANESLNYSIRNLRGFLSAKVGNPAKMSAAQMVNFVKNILDGQAADGKITGYGNVKCTIVADKTRIDYDCIPIYPNNFFIVTAHAATVIV